jgi:hypothetical protein
MVVVSRRSVLRGSLGLVVLGAFEAEKEIHTRVRTAVLSNAPLVDIRPTPSGAGYWQAAADGGVFSFGDASFEGSMGGRPLNMPVVGMAATPSGGGYWLSAADGGVFSFGDAQFHGGMAGQPLNAPVVGIAATRTGGGYWLVAADGGVFSFGDAQFHGGMAGQPLNAPMVGIAAAPTGGGYWLVAADGGVFTFGDLDFHGSLGGQSDLNPVTAIAATTSGGGYWLTSAAGEVFGFGDAQSVGSMAGTELAGAVNAIRATPDGGGYWLSAVDGGIFAFGTARFLDRAVYTPVPPPTTSRGTRAAELARSWVGRDYRGVNGDRWGVPGKPEHWCADFVTYTWHRAGIPINRISSVYWLEQWGRDNSMWADAGELSSLGLGDAVIYGTSHTGLVVDIHESNGVVVTADGNWGGRGSGTDFATSSRVALNTWDHRTGRGAGNKRVTGFVRAE